MQFNIETRQFGKNWDTFIKRSGNILENAAVKGIDYRLQKNQPTFWGQFNGRNAEIRRRKEREHEERLARIKAGTDNRSLAKEYLRSRTLRNQGNLEYNREFQREKYRDARDDRREDARFNRDVRRHELGMK